MKNDRWTGTRILAILLTVGLFGLADTDRAGDDWRLGDANVLRGQGNFAKGNHGGDDDDDLKCRHIAGRLEETLIHPVGAPGDPIGRVVGESRGSLNGAETAILTSLGPGPDGTLLADTVNIFVTGPGDSLAAQGQAVFTPISQTDVKDDLTLTILPNESTGKYQGATGTIQLEGVGFNLFPSAVPGQTTFIFRYSGEICRPRADHGDGDDDDDDDLD
jgi:hypothetical protein